MKYTNLELVQDILSSMDGDEVNSASDTVESRQVLAVIKQTYFNLIAIGELPRDNDLFQLNASGDTNKPVQMSLPDNAQEIFWLKYDVQTEDDPTVTYQELTPLPFHEFVEMVTGLNPDDDDVISYEYDSGVNTWTLYCKNNVRPNYYTTCNDGTILFDAYDAAIDDTLKKSKTMVYGQLQPTWNGSDSFTLPLDDKQFQRLLNEAKALAYAEIKQSVHAKAEKTARDIKIDQQSSKTKVPLITDYDRVAIQGRMNYGRLKPTGRYK